MNEPTKSGRAAEHERLQELAEPRGFKVLRGTYQYAADLAGRKRPDEWSVEDAKGAIVYHSSDADVVAAWLSDKRLVSEPE
jgi:hypothetical protein